MISRRGTLAMFDKRPRPTVGAGKMAMGGANYKATRSEMCDLVEQGPGWRLPKVMSALPPKADIRWRARHVRFVP